MSSAQPVNMGAYSPGFYAGPPEAPAVVPAAAAPMAAALPVAAVAPMASASGTSAQPPAMPALIAADVASAVTSSFFLAPVVGAVDKAVVECASGRATTAGSFSNTMHTLVSDPLAFLQSPEFLLIWAVYACTYIAANVVSTTCKRLAVDDAIPKFSVVLSVNIYASLIKDAAFAKLFGDAGGSMMIPIVTYTLWFIRDACAILTSFNVRSFALARRWNANRTADAHASALAPSCTCPSPPSPF